MLDKLLRSEDESLRGQIANGPIEDLKREELFNEGVIFQ